MAPKPALLGSQKRHEEKRKRGGGSGWIYPEGTGGGGVRCCSAMTRRGRRKKKKGGALGAGEVFPRGRKGGVLPTKKRTDQGCPLSETKKGAATKGFRVTACGRKKGGKPVNFPRRGGGGGGGKNGRLTVLLDM